MTAVATDADNDPLTFTWSFGGATMTGATVTAKLTGDGTVAVQLTVTDGKGGSATDSRNVTIGTMTGTWSFVAAQCGTQAGEQPGMFTLTQTGTSWTGRPFWPEAWCNITRQTAGIFHDPGTIDDQGNFTAPRISVTTGGAAGSVFLDFNLIGKMDATGRKITGKIFQSGFNGDPFTLMKQ